MKIFRFRPDRVLQWRQTERDLAAGRVQAAEASLIRARAEVAAIISAQARGPDVNPTGATLANWAVWKVTLHRHLQGAEQRAATAQAQLNTLLAALLEANRRVKLLTKLKAAERSRWQQDYERETAAFSTDMHLSRLAAGKLLARQATIGTDGRVAQVDRAPAF